MTEMSLNNQEGIINNVVRKIHKISCVEKTANFFRWNSIWGYVPFEIGRSWHGKEIYITKFEKDPVTTSILLNEV